MAQHIAISPFKCRMWALHDRLGDEPDSAAYRQLIESIRQHGQRRPALGRSLPSSSSDGVEVELIYGARRLAAARELCTDLMVELREIDDRAALVEMDIENRLREDISAYERGHSLRAPSVLASLQPRRIWQRH